MDLWIRSQDKRILQKIDNIYLNANYDNKRICTECNNSDIELGTYKSKERALEVLDEIQKLIKVPDYKINDRYEAIDLILKSYILTQMTKVYEMPKE